MTLQKIGGWCALGWLFFGIAGIAVTALRGNAGVSDPFNGAQMMRYIITEPFLYKLSPLMGAVAGLALMMVVWGVYDYFSNGVFIRLASAFGTLASGLFFLSGMSGVTGGEMLAQAHAQNALATEAAYLPTLVIADAAGVGGIVAMGVWLAIVSWEGLRSTRLSKVWCYVGILSGLLSAGAVVNSALGLVGSMLCLIAMPWLGVHLVRNARD